MDLQGRYPTASFPTQLPRSCQVDALIGLGHLTGSKGGEYVGPPVLMPWESDVGPGSSATSIGTVSSVRGLASPSTFISPLPHENSSDAPCEYLVFDKLEQENIDISHHAHYPPPQYDCNIITDHRSIICRAQDSATPLTPLCSQSMNILPTAARGHGLHTPVSTAVYGRAKTRRTPMSAKKTKRKRTWNNGSYLEPCQRRRLRFDRLVKEVAGLKKECAIWKDLAESFVGNPAVVMGFEQPTSRLSYE